jgi:uncharacterized protein YecE (DUF72 family)
MESWHIGCSGFHYKHWIGTFYPEKLAQTKWFDFYCQHFNTLELNVTFYRFPRLHNLQTWYNGCPADFRFSVKAPRAITHFKKFNNVEAMIGSFYATVKEGLQEKCGCILFQLPTAYYYGADKLQRIISCLDLSLPNVLEFRHESWWNDHVFETLAAHNISFCGMSHPGLPPSIIKNTPLLYYRFHGSEQLYSSRYTENQLRSFEHSLRGDVDVKEAYVFFNNDINSSAIYNAKELKTLVLVQESPG